VTYFFKIGGVGIVAQLARGEAQMLVQVR